MSRFFRLGRLLLLGVSILFTVSQPLFAQSATGGIKGTVVDTGGAALPGVTITAHNPATGVTRVTVSADQGAFVMPLMQVGTYEVTADLEGFKSAKYGSVAVNIGTDARVAFTLHPALAESITVEAEAPVVETTRTQVSSVVGEQYVANLPTNGRNFLDFTLTTPGVVKDVRLGDLSFAGQRGTLNSLVVDGGNNDNTFFGQALGRTGSGRAPYQFSQDAVREFQINSNAYSAEYGRAGGAVINVITKSGTNQLQGSAFYFARDESWNANDYINELNNRPKGIYQYDQYGVSVGGPIVRDKHFFFFNYDAQRNTTPNLVVLNIPSGTPTDADTVAGIAKLQQKANSYDRNQDQDVYLLKTDSSFSFGQFSFRYNRQEFTGKNFENGGITNAEEHTGDSLVNTDTWSVSLVSPLGSNLFNEARAQYATDSEPGKANSDDPEAVIRQSGQTVITIGRNFFSPRETTIDRWQVADSVTWLRGNHSLKAGFDVSNDDILNFFPGNFSGSYQFDTIAAYNTGKPSRFLQAFAGPGTTGPTTEPNIRETAFYVQDQWQPSFNWTVNLGLRYDTQAIEQPDVRNPDAALLAAGYDTSYINEDGDNVGPRIGVAWDPRGDGHTVVRAGYGIFYGRTPAIMIGTGHSNNGINVQTITFTGALIPTYPNIYDQIPTGAVIPKPTIFVFDPDFENPTVQQASFGVDHELTNELAVGFSYQYVEGNNLQRSIDRNIGSYGTVTTPISTGGSATYVRYGGDRPFANFGRVIAFESSADSKYWGTTIELRKRYSRGWQANLSYTYSKATDNRPDATAVVPGGSDDAKYAQDPNNLGGEWAWSDNDVRNRIVLAGLWDVDSVVGDLDTGWKRALLGGWQISGIVTWQSGQPYSAVVLSDLNNDGNARNDRAPGTARNQFRLDDYFSVDPRITKTIALGGETQLQLIAEAFNVFNETNVNLERNVYYALTNGQLVPQSNFGTPTSSAGPRIVQLAAKVRF
ncbi:MAG: carboxypeptidase regulatory-like domain-containing protein [Thermoanaerobaculia bacterium]|jgi:outer membrane receptor protein involved in Fe transport